MQPKSLILSLSTVLLLFNYVYKNTYNSLQGIFTTMIEFVTWPPFLYHQGGQVMQPITLLRMPLKLI